MNRKIWMAIAASAAGLAGASVSMAAVDAKHQDHHRKAIEQLQHAQGADFDRQYADMMAKDHGQALSELRAMQQQLTNKQVSDLVEKTIPVLERHQQQAQQLQQRIRG